MVATTVGAQSGRLFPAGILRWKNHASEAANPTYIEVLLGGTLTVIANLGTHVSFAETSYRGYDQRGLGPDVELAAGHYWLRMTNPAVDAGAGAEYADQDSGSCHVTVVPNGYLYAWEDHGGPPDFNDFIIEVASFPPAVVAAGWTVGAPAWKTGGRQPVRNLNATIADGSQEPDWRDWGWDPPLSGTLVSYTSSVHLATYTSGDPNLPGSYTTGAEVVSYTGTSFPVITPHNLASSAAGHTGAGSKQDSITMSGYGLDPDATVLMKVVPNYDDGPGPASWAVSRIAAGPDAPGDLRGSGTAMAPGTLPDRRWWTWDNPAGVDHFVVVERAASYDYAGLRWNPDSYLETGDPIITMTVPPGTGAYSDPAEVAYALPGHEAVGGDCLLYTADSGLSLYGDRMLTVTPYGADGLAGASARAISRAVEGVNILSRSQYDSADVLPYEAPSGWVGIHGSPVLQGLGGPYGVDGGRCLQLGSSTGVGSPGMRTVGTGTAGIPIVAGKGYVACFKARAYYALGVVTEYYWYLEDGTPVFGTPTTGNPTSTYARGGISQTGWIGYYEDTGVVVAPPGAAFMALGLGLTNINVANDAQCLFDKIGVYELDTPLMLFAEPDY